MLAMKCPHCGSPNAPLGHVRERNVDLVLVDMRCLDCGFRWSAVMTWVAYQKDIAGHVSFFGVLKKRGKKSGG